MLYIRIEDHRLLVAHHHSLTPRALNEAMTMGKVVSDAPVLHYAETTLGATTSLREALAETSLRVEGFREALTEGPVTVLVSGPATVVPFDLLRDLHEDDEKLLLTSTYHFTDADERRVCCDDIDILRQRLVYGVPVSVVETIAEEFGRPQLLITSTLTPLLKYFADAAVDGSDRIYVHCRHAFIDVFAIGRRQLKLLNSYPVGSAADATYYVLGLFKTMGYSMATIPCHLLGDPAMVTTLHSALSRFLAHIEDFDSKDLGLSRDSDVLPLDLLLSLTSA